LDSLGFKVIVDGSTLNRSRLVGLRPVAIRVNNASTQSKKCNKIQMKLAMIHLSDLYQPDAEAHSILEIICYLDSLNVHMIDSNISKHNILRVQSKHLIHVCTFVEGWLPDNHS
jgi:hypothetical protein